MHIIAFASNKGGVGKTTSSVSVAWYLSQLQPGRVLLIDADDQGNSTETAGGTRDVVGLGEFLAAGTVPAVTFRQQYTQPINATLDLLGASHWLEETTADLETRKVRGSKGFPYQLAEKLQPLSSLYEYVVIDCPPALNKLNYCALVAADYHVAVALPAPLAFRGLDRIIRAAEAVAQDENPRLKCAGILFTCYNPEQRGRVRHETVQETKAAFGEDLLLPSIREDSMIPRSHGEGEPLPKYAPTSRAAADYENLTRVLLERVTLTQPNQTLSPS